jgi:glycosyltransferase involved in cell wall biosynthesis
MRQMKLVLVGDFERDAFHSCYAELREQITTQGLSGRVMFTGFISDEEMASLLNAAEVLVMPSFDEGFGLPVLEAMACGTPVVASRAGALPEVGADACKYFDPRSAAELEERLSEVLTCSETRTEMRRRGLRRAGQFSWELSAQALLVTFEQLAGNKTGIHTRMGIT